MNLSEGDLEINFTNALEPGSLKFDQMNPTLPNFHGISAMHRVDFIVEFEEAVVFVEVKDPGNPRAQEQGLKKFYNELKDGMLSSTFVSKFLDSFVYRWAEDKINKPVYYISLVTLETALLLNLSDEVARKLPPKGKPVVRWQRAFFENCQIFNIETWNENFPSWPVTRISTAAALVRV